MRPYLRQTEETMHADVVVIGGGTVGASIAYGLAGGAGSVLLLDGEDRDYRAASANFGLVWQHGKGMGMPAYQRLTRDSVDAWSSFTAELSDVTQIDLQFEHDGGLAICASEAEFVERRATLERLQRQLGNDKPDWEMLGRDDLAQLLPQVRLGQEVVGASYGYRDGHVNPLRLLKALHLGIVRRGGQLRGGCKVQTLSADGDGYCIDTGSERFSATRVVIAAGLGAKALGAQVDLHMPIRPQRGQLLVTERLQPFLPLPTLNIRQTREGTVMIGATHEEAGFDASTTAAAGAALSADAIRRIPALSEAKLVRQWAGLRIMTPDGYPIYAQSQTHPGVFVAQCHSGVTLAATHATVLAEAVTAGRLPSSLDVFHQRRFDVSQAA
jgi:glycine/D-amino acid oxidase-like deaminating enzyme